jgi:hypothetical protein
VRRGVTRAHNVGIWARAQEGRRGAREDCAKGVEGTRPGDGGKRGEEQRGGKGVGEKRMSLL